MWFSWKDAKRLEGKEIKTDEKKADVVRISRSCDCLLPRYFNELPLVLSHGFSLFSVNSAYPGGRESLDTAYGRVKLAYLTGPPAPYGYLLPHSQV
jgi:hypothetical protein